MCRGKDHGGRRCGTTREQSLARKVRRTKALLADVDPHSARARTLADRLGKAQAELQEVRAEEQRVEQERQRLLLQEQTAPGLDYTLPEAPGITVSNDAFQSLLENQVTADEAGLDWDVIEGLLSQMSDGYKNQSREEMLDSLLESGFYAQEHWGDITTLAPVASILKQRVVEKTLAEMSHVDTRHLVSYDDSLYERLRQGEDPTTIRRLAVSGLVGMWADHYSRRANGRYTGDLDYFQEAAQVLSQRGPEGLADSVREESLPKSIVAREFILAQYKQTQALFAEKGITHLRLYRGMSWGEFAEESVFENIPDWAHPVAGTFSHQHEVPLSGLSSFTTSKATAEFFATHTAGGRESGLGTVISATVPVSRLVSTPLSGMGCFAEREVILMGGEGNWHVESNYGDPSTWDEFIEFTQGQEPEPSED